MLRFEVVKIFFYIIHKVIIVNLRNFDISFFSLLYPILFDQKTQRPCGVLSTRSYLLPFTYVIECEDYFFLRVRNKVAVNF